MNHDIVLVRVDRQRKTGEKHPRHIHPPLDLFYIRSALADQAMAPVGLIDEWLMTGSSLPLTERVLACQPKIVVVRAMTWCLREACWLAKALRQRGIVTVAVGEQVTHRAARPAVMEVWDACWDIPVLGEPEQAVPDLLNQLLQGRAITDLAPAYWARVKGKKPFQVEPDRLPPPRFTQQDLLAYPFPFPVPGRVIHRWGYLISGWGCPYDCKHCTEVVRKSVGSNLRLRDPITIVDEMEQLVGLGAEAIAFEDDTLFCNRRHLLAICSEIRRRRLRIRWMANARPDELDEQRVSAAAAAGAVLLKIGIESGSPRLIEQMGKSRSGQHWLEQVRSGVAHLKREGVASVGLFMVGIPGETEAEVKQTQALARSLNNEYVQVQRFSPYPDVAMGSGQALIATSETNLYHYDPDAPSLCAISSERLAELHQAFYTRFYLRPAYLYRHLRLFWRWYLTPSFLKALPARVAYLLGTKKAQPSKVKNDG